MKSCQICRVIYEDQKSCATCGIDLSDKFSGMVVIIDSEKSEVAKIIGKTAPGRYSIKTK